MVNNIKDEVIQTLNRIQKLSSLVRTAQGMGYSYDGNRDLYTALGYSLTPTYDEYNGLYRREGIPKRVNDAPCNAVWRTPPRIYDIGDTTLSPFEKAWNDLVDKLQIWSKINRADKLLGLGDYSVLLLGFDDVTSEMDMKQPVSDSAKLVYLQCYSAAFAIIETSVINPQEPRYGLPETYKVKISESKSVSALTVPTPSISEISVHWTRIIHLVENNLVNEVSGDPRLMNPFNRLMDIQKLIGGDAEMFWRGARPGYAAVMDPEFRLDKDDPELIDMKTQMQEYENNLRRVLYLQGVDIKSLETQVVDPTNHLDMQLQDIAAGTGIPKRMLTGSERGDLASSQDRENWIAVVEDRRTWFATPIIIKPLLDRLILFNALPEPQEGGYVVEWPDLRAKSDKEKADIGLVRSTAIKNYLASSEAPKLVPPEVFIRICLGLTEEQIKEVQAWLDELKAAGIEIVIKTPTTPNPAEPDPMQGGVQ